MPDLKRSASFMAGNARKYLQINDQLASSDPLASRFWWCFKHPITRVVTCTFTLFTNLYVYYGDPASFSPAKSYGTFVGDIYHGVFQPDDPEWLALRWLLMLIVAGLGTWLGILIQQRVLRDYCHLTLFGYDNHRDPNRDPLADQDGAFLVVGAVVCGLWFVSLKVYGLLLGTLGVDSKHIPDASMYGWTFAGYNLALAGVLTFLSDWFLLGSVVDQMLQSVNQEGSAGRLAYAGVESSGDHPRADYVKFAPCVRLLAPPLRRAAAWWVPRRVLLTRLWLALGWPTMGAFMIVYFGKIMNVLEPAAGGAQEQLEGVTVGAEMNRFWSREWNDEYTRMIAASLVATCNLAIVTQEWDFPNFR